MIPKRLIRTVPTDTSTEVEQWWQTACEMHPDWEHVTYREPVDPAAFPITGHLFSTCESGAQKADLIRIEALWWGAGIYLDSDVEVVKPLDSFLHAGGVAGWEDESHICNAVLAFEAGHPALKTILELAIQRHDQGTWNAGIGVVTEVLRDHPDVLLLPPGSWYPVHYRQKMPPTEVVKKQNPWAYAIHHWSHSWA